MTREQVKEVLERVLSWPRERQEDAAAVLAAMEEQDTLSLHLTRDQADEVRRRRAQRKEVIPAEAVFRRFRTSRA